MGISESVDKVLSSTAGECSDQCQLTCEGAARDCLDPLVDRLEPKSANSVLGVLRDELRDG
jgi:hypothetical protein